MSPLIATDEITALVFDALREFNATRSDEEESVDLTIDSPLFGDEGALDSLGLVNLVFLTERRIEQTYSVAVSLADENALSSDENPFRTVRSYVEFAAKLVNAARDA